MILMIMKPLCLNSAGYLVNYGKLGYADIFKFLTPILLQRGLVDGRSIVKRTES